VTKDLLILSQLLHSGLDIPDWPLIIELEWKEVVRPEESGEVQTQNLDQEKGGCRECLRGFSRFW
jgi:hypothetical protein